MLSSNSTLHAQSCHSGVGAPESSRSIQNNITPNAGVERGTSIDDSKSRTIHHPDPTCHSGEAGSSRTSAASPGGAVGAPESSRSNQNSIAHKAGSIQTQSESTPSGGITPKAWIPGPSVLAHASRDDAAAGPSGETARNAVTPFHPSTLSRQTAALECCATAPQNPIREIREIRGENTTPPRHHATTPPRPNPPIREIRGQANAAITRPVTVGTAVTQPSAIAERDISYVMDCVREGRFESRDLKALILTIRGLPPAQAAIAAGMKRSLPWFSGSTFHRRRGNEFFKAAWFLVFDLDHVGDIEGLKRRALDKLPWLRYAFQSVRDGVKLVAEFASPITKEDDFRILWKYLALQIGKLLEAEVDSTPDPARACFLSYDPGLLVNSSCRPLEVKKTLREAEAILDLMRFSRPATNLRHSGGERLRREGTESSPCGNSPSQAQANAGSIQTQSESTPSEGITPKAWIPGPSVLAHASRDDADAGPSGETAQNAVPPFHPSTLSRSNPIREIRVIRGQTQDDYEKAAKVVQKLAQMVIPYSDWYRIGLALYAGFGERGRPLWDLFLANPHYRDTQRGLDAKWHSFRGVREITLATLFEIGGRYGL